MIPKKPGWYWFKPTHDTPTPTGLLNLKQWVVVLVGESVALKTNSQMGQKYLVVRFPRVSYDVKEMKGKWNGPLKPPKS